MSTFKDTTLLLSRVILGVILIAHGWQKFSTYGIGGVTELFASMGVPAPGFAAVVQAIIELAGGIMILAGLFIRYVGVIVALSMLGAAIFAHISNGLFVETGGWELVGAIGAAALALAGAGAGLFSIDGVLARKTIQQN